ncbi:MAG: hypothetical protein BZY75_02770 [SAR202 cluster bacterium Io17-Chloro-G7]|nr:MAG: hypothetical protein BZY75_02770 [SAR202 cluster bacterium Io17-Chloro-G7]
MAIESQEYGEKKDPRLTSQFIITGLATGHTVFHWILQSFVVLLPEIQSTFNLTGVGAGGILTVRELVSGLVSLPGGVIVDGIRRHWGWLLGLCLGATCLGSLVMGVSPVYPLLLLGIAVVGMSHSIWHLPASASLAYHIPHRRSMALAFHGVGGSIGDVAGPLATGALLAVLGWRGILSVYAVAPFFLAFLAIWSFNAIGRLKPDEEVSQVDFSSRVEMSKRLLRNRLLWGITFVRGLRAMSLVALVTVLHLYLGNELGQSPFARGIHIGLLIAIGLVAKPVMGYLSDRWGRKQVLVPGLAWSSIFAILLVAFDIGPELTVTIALMGLFLYPDQPILTAVALEVVGREVATTGLGIVAFSSFLMAAESALVAGGLYEAVRVETALYYVAALFALAALIFALLPLTGSVSSPAPP